MCYLRQIFFSCLHTLSPSLSSLSLVHTLSLSSSLSLSIHSTYQHAGSSLEGEYGRCEKSAEHSSKEIERRRFHPQCWEEEVAGTLSLYHCPSVSLSNFNSLLLTLTPLLSYPYLFLLQHSQSRSEQRESATRRHLLLIEEELINKQKVYTPPFHSLCLYLHTSLFTLHSVLTLFLFFSRFVFIGIILFCILFLFHLIDHIFIHNFLFLFPYRCGRLS